MVTAIALLNVERDKLNAIAEELADLAGISEVYSVSGNFDLVTIIRVKNNDDLARLITERMARVEGITHTHTMLAFQAYSRHDLEGMFAVGQED